MSIIKSYTDLGQSKKLAEILPIESADLYYDRYGIPVFIDKIVTHESIKNDKYGHLIPCWSLAALLDVLSYPQLFKDKLGSRKVGWMVSVYPNDCRYDSFWHDNQIDACYEMILKLYEQKLL